MGVEFEDNIMRTVLSPSQLSHLPEEQWPASGCMEAFRCWLIRYRRRHRGYPALETQREEALAYAEFLKEMSATLESEVGRA